jgi:hypothetical protein
MGIGTASGLPGGVSASWAFDTISLTGTPNQSGNFNYTIPLTGGCGNVEVTGTLKISPANTVSAASTSPSVCINTVLPAITHTTNGATGIGTATGLPVGVTATWASNTITISGTPTEKGTFTYRIPLLGGCNVVNATGIITINETPTGSLSVNDKSGISEDDGIICSGESVLLTAGGGSKFKWENGDTTALLLVSPLTTTDYQVTITSSEGCSTVEKTKITVNEKPNPTVTTTNPNCPLTQTGVATSSTGTGWNYLWSNGANTTSITNLKQGLYTLTVTNDKGCEGIASVNLVDSGVPITVNVTKTDVLCEGSSSGSITLGVTGGTSPYTYAWSPNAVGATASSVSNLPKGNYNVTITEGGVYKCESVQAIEIIEPEFGIQTTIVLKENSGLFEDDGEFCQGDKVNLMVSALPTPGSTILSYLWNDKFKSTQNQITVDEGGTYQVTVTDSKGCTSIISKTINSSSTSRVRGTTILTEKESSRS